MAQMERYSTVMQQSLTPSLTGEAFQQNTAWQFLGPSNFGGRTRALVIHSTQPNTMYAGSVSGGVWKTTDGGSSWRAVGDRLANMAIGALALDRANPEIIYAGTGEGIYITGWRQGAGIFKSTDGGNSWVKLAGTNSTDFFYVNKIIPATSQRLYAATLSGIWRSLDGGATWTAIHSGFSFSPRDLAYRTENGRDVLFATIGGPFNEDVGVYRNTDAAGAGVWEKVMGESGMGRITLAVAPSNPQIVYAAVALPQFNQSLTEPGVYGIYRSTQGGAATTWTTQVRGTTADKANQVMFSWARDAFAAECGLRASGFYNNGWYANTMAIDPLDAQKVWLGGVDLFRSDDGGANWGIASFGAPEQRNAPQYAHAYHHALVFHPQYDGVNNRVLFVAGDGGLSKTDNASANTARGANAACAPANSAVTWTKLNNGYAATQFFSGAVSPDGTRWWGGAAGFGILTGSETAGANGWREVQNNGGGGNVVIDPLSLNTLYTSTNFGWVRKSSDGGATFVTPPLPYLDSVLYNAPLVMDGSDNRRLWFGARSLLSSVNAGATWFPASAPLANSVFSAVAVAPHDSLFILGGTTAGEIHRFHSSASTSSKPREGFVSWLAFDPVTPNVVYATYSTFGGKHVWRSLDGGLSWSGLDGSGAGALPDLPAHCLIVDPTNRQRLYLGTDAGVFVSLNGGTSWMVEQTGFPNVATEALALTTTNATTQLYAFTYGRGAWRAPLGAAPCRVTASPGSFSLAATGSSSKLTITAPNGCAWQAVVNPSGAGWLTFTGAANGAGNGALSVNAAAWTGSAARSGTFTVGGRSFTVTQPAAIEPLRATPVINIASPLANQPDGSYRTTQATLSLSGTVTNPASVSRFDLTNGGYGVNSIGLRDNGAWAVSELTLRPGLNRLVFTAIGIQGRYSAATLDVIYTPTGALQLIGGIGYSPGYQYETGYALTSNLTPDQILLDSQGDLLFLESYWQRIRKIELATGRLSTVITHPSLGWMGPSGPSGQALAIDPQGNFIFADETRHQVRRFNRDGSTAVVAGTGSVGFSGDGGAATVATLNYPRSLAVDPQGNIYVADAENFRIRRISVSGVITTIAGNGTRGNTGDNGPALIASFNSVRALALDWQGNLMLFDSVAGVARKIDFQTGRIVRIAGGGSMNLTREGANALPIELLQLAGECAPVQATLLVSADEQLPKEAPPSPKRALGAI